MAYYNYKDLSSSDKQYYEEGKFFTNASVQQKFAKTVKKFKQFCENTLKWNLAEDGTYSWISYNAYDTDDVDLIQIVYRLSVRAQGYICCILRCFCNENTYNSTFRLLDGKNNVIWKEDLEVFITALKKWVEQ